MQIRISINTTENRELEDFYDEQHFIFGTLYVQYLLCT